MSGCPEKDIHSVYIDGELPQQYRAEYEAHVAGCAACKALLEQMRGLHQRCAADAESHRADSVYLAQSFDRLQTKLRYSANVQKAGQTQHVFAFSAARWAVSAAAAAAVFAVIFTPVYIKSAAGSQEQALTAIASAELEPLANKRVVVDGNISHTDLSSLAVASAAKAEDSPASGEDSGNSQQPAAQQRTVRATATVSTAGSAADMGRRLTSVDVFRPERLDAAQSLSIKIEPPIPYYSGADR